MNMFDRLIAAAHHWRNAIIGITTLVTMSLGLVFIAVAEDNVGEAKAFYFGVSITLVLIALVQIPLLIATDTSEETNEELTVPVPRLKKTLHVRGDAQRGTVPTYVIEMFAQKLKRPLLAFAVDTERIELRDLLPGTIGWCSTFQLTLLHADRSTGIAPRNSAVYGAYNRERRFAWYRDDDDDLFVLGFGRPEIGYGHLPESDWDSFVGFKYLGEVDGTPLP